MKEREREKQGKEGGREKEEEDPFRKCNNSLWAFLYYFHKSPCLLSLFPTIISKSIKGECHKGVLVLAGPSGLTGLSQWTYQEQV